MAGLTVRRQDTGAVILKLTDRITRVIGTITPATAAPDYSGSFNIPQTDGTPWFFLGVPPGDSANNLVIALNGWTISWQYMAPGSRIVYGVY